MARYHALCGREDKEMGLLCASAGAFGRDTALAARACKALSALLANPTPSSTTINEQLSAPEPASLFDFENEVLLTIEQAIAAPEMLLLPISIEPKGSKSSSAKFRSLLLMMCLQKLALGISIG